MNFSSWIVTYYGAVVTPDFSIFSICTECVKPLIVSSFYPGIEPVWVFIICFSWYLPHSDEHGELLYYGQPWFLFHVFFWHDFSAVTLATNNRIHLIYSYCKEILSTLLEELECTVQTRPNRFLCFINFSLLYPGNSSVRTLDFSSSRWTWIHFHFNN